MSEPGSSGVPRRSSGSHRAPRTESWSRRVPTPGQRLGPFVFDGALGQGGMGAVFAVHDDAGRALALKLLTRSGDSKVVLERFRREAEVTAGLRHPGIVAVHGAGELEGWPYIAYELVQGRTLEEALQRGERDLALRVLLEAAEALGHAHTRGIVHRDVKPANILVDEAGHARVADFGLAQAAELERLTLSGALVGTPTSMAPEQITSERGLVGPHTDVWGLGVILYRILTGADPFQGQNLPELSARILSTEPRPPRTLAPGVTPALEAVCLRALRKPIEARQPDGQVLAGELRRALDAGASPAPTPGAPTRALVAGGAALILGAVGLGLQLGSGPPSGDQAGTAASTSPAPSRLGARAQARLDETRLALEPLTRGELEETSRRVGALPRETHEVGPARELLLTAQAAQAEALLAAQSSDQPITAWLPRLRLLVALADALPGAPPFPESSRAANATIAAWAREAGRGRTPPYESLSLLIRCRARVDDPVPGADLFDALLAAMFDSSAPGDVWLAKVMPLVVQLDVGMGTFEGRTTAHLQRFAPHGTDPWSRYCRLRLSLTPTPEGRVALKGLQQLWREPPPDFVLGPTHWGEVTAILSDELPPAERLPLVEEACRRDPRSPNLQFKVAQALSELGEHARAIEAAERGDALFLQLGYDRRPSTLPRYDRMLTELVGIYARAERRAEACARYQELMRRFQRRDEPAEQTWPWLKEVQ